MYFSQVSLYNFPFVLCRENKSAVVTQPSQPLFCAVRVALLRYLTIGIVLMARVTYWKHNGGNRSHGVPQTLAPNLCCALVVVVRFLLLV